MSRCAKVTALLLAIILAGCSGPKGVAIRVIVPRGASFAVATDSLKHAGLVSYPLLFRVFARVKGDDRNIKVTFPLDRSIAQHLLTTLD